MTQSLSNLVLIGMPGAGKSTVGLTLAQQTARDFVDTDLLIQATQQRTLQEIVDTAGYIVLRRIEEEVLLGLTVHNSIIATGGSAVYSELAMAHLKANGLVVFLDVDLATLESRVHNFSTRGLAKRPDQTLAELFHERQKLYETYADITIHSVDLTQEEVVARIIGYTRQRRRGEPL